MFDKNFKLLKVSKKFRVVSPTLQRCQGREITDVVPMNQEKLNLFENEKRSCRKGHFGRKTL